MMFKPLTCVGCPLYEQPHGKKMGFALPSGTGLNGVMVVHESLGEQDEMQGMPLVDGVGYRLFQELGRVGIKRDDFYIYDAIACRPPWKKFIELPMGKKAIDHCSPNLDAAIEHAKGVAKSAGKTFVIVTLGRIAFKRIMGLDDRSPIMGAKMSFWAYPFWSDRYGAWVLGCESPNFLLRGKTELWPTVQFTFGRALEIASEGFSYEDHSYLLDPTPAQFYGWAEQALIDLKAYPSLVLSYDIETPYKKKVGEEELGKEEDADHTILRISFCYRPNEAVSVRWNADYLPAIELLFAQAPTLLGWNSDLYDLPRVSRHCLVGGKSLDAMIAWHILNTALPKGLGFVTPFIVQRTAMWKYMSDASPALYNAKDADMALRIYIRVMQDLKRYNLNWVWDNHVLRLNEALRYMTGKGVIQDDSLRLTAEKRLVIIIDTVEEKMEAAVPKEARKWKIYKKLPKRPIPDLQERVELYPIKYCEVCGLQKPTKTHAKLCPTWKITTLLEPQTVWAEPLPFKISKLGLTNYQSFLKHEAIKDRKEGKVTFNEDAIIKLMQDYPKDPLYPCILQHREARKLLSTYIGEREMSLIEVADDYVLQGEEEWADAI